MVLPGTGNTHPFAMTTWRGAVSPLIQSCLRANVGASAESQVRQPSLLSQFVSAAGHTARGGVGSAVLGSQGHPRQGFYTS